MCLEFNVTYFGIIYGTFFEKYKEEKKNHSAGLISALASVLSFTCQHQPLKSFLYLKTYFKNYFYLLSIISNLCSIMKYHVVLVTMSRTRLMKNGLISEEKKAIFRRLVNLKCINMINAPWTVISGPALHKMIT